MLQTTVLDIDALKSTTTMALYPDTYAVTAALMQDGLATPLKSGTGSITLTPAGGQSLTINLQ